MKVDEKALAAALRAVSGCKVSDPFGYDAALPDVLSAAILAYEAAKPAVDAGASLRMCEEMLGFDPSNHHNALACPYCNPDKMVLAKPAAASEAGCEPVAWRYKLKISSLNRWTYLDNGSADFFGPQYETQPLYAAPKADSLSSERETVKALREALAKEAHVANEWADMAVNGLQHLRNIKAGIETADDALTNSEACLVHCQEVSRSDARALTQEGGS